MGKRDEAWTDESQPGRVPLSPLSSTTTGRPPYRSVMAPRPRRSPAALLGLGAVAVAVLLLLLWALLGAGGGHRGAVRRAPAASARPSAAAPSAATSPRASSPNAPSSAAPTPSSAAGAPAGTPLRPAGVTVLDPRGDEDRRPGAAAAADGDPGTAWRSQIYRTAEFGGLKQGIGVLVDLGRSQPVGSVRLVTARPGADVELRTGDVPAPDAGGYRLLATSAASPVTVTLRPPAPVTARYVLLWFTRLARDDSGYRLSVSEVSVTG